MGGFLDRAVVRLRCHGVWDVVQMQIGSYTQRTTHPDALGGALGDVLGDRLRSMYAGLGRPEPLRVVTTGGRAYEQRSVVELAIELLASLADELVVYHGGASGADRLVDEACRARGITVEAVSAEWRRYGRAAGPIRNRRMLLFAQPHFVVAFPGGKGTADLVTRAQAAGIPVVSVLPMQ